MKWFPYRYKYVNKAYRENGKPHGRYCNPVKNERGKCIVSKTSQLVIFQDGTRQIVIRRCLRLVEK